MTDPIKTAQELFAQGFNCSQAVFSAFAAELGINDEMALKIASPFGGGMTRQGDVCGAVIGALMVLGLQKGSATLETKEAPYEIANEFLKRFKTGHGTLLCRELIRFDISKPDELQAARKNSAFQLTCPGLVKDAAELVSEILKE